MYHYKHPIYICFVLYLVGVCIGMFCVLFGGMCAGVCGELRVFVGLVCVCFFEKLLMCTYKA